MGVISDALADQAFSWTSHVRRSGFSFIQKGRGKFGFGFGFGARVRKEKVKRDAGPW